MRQAHQAQAVDEARENDQPDRKRPNPRKLFKSPMRYPDLRIGLVRHWLKEQPGERGNSADPNSRRQHVDDVAQPVESSGPPFGCAGMARPDQRGDSHRRRRKQPVSCKVWASAIRARLEGSYDERITQRLIFQPRAELNFSAQDMPVIGVGSGLTDFELGARLRYEIRRELAPYVGVEWSRKAGDTARLARLAGEDPDAVSFVAGVRVWF